LWLDLNTGFGTIKFRKSTDGGANFGPNIFLTGLNGIYGAQFFTDTPPYGSRFSISSIPTIAVDKNNGYIYVAYTELDNGLDVKIVRSTNGGDSWSAPIIATDNVYSDQFFPWLSVDQSGRVILTYLDDRNDLSWSHGPIWIDAYLAESVNNGLSFSSPNLRVTSQSFDALQGKWSYDYQGITSTDGIVHPAWTDHRNNNEDIFASRINIGLTSNSANVLAGNNQRKIARQSDGTNHMVYESNGEIWYARRTSTDTDWNHFTRLSNGLLDGAKTNPSIYERDGKIFVVWQKNTGSSHDITFHKSTDGGATWPGSNRKVLATNVGTNPPLPVIVSPASGQLMVVYRTATNLSYLTSSDDGNTWSTVSAVPSTGSNAAYQSMAVTTTYWGSARTALVNTNTSGNGTIYYRYH
jgi:hypothetical protein